MDDICENIEEYYPNKKNIKMIVFDFIIADSNKKFNPLIAKLFSRGRKLNISLIFITQLYIAAPKNIWINFTNHLFM